MNDCLLLTKKNKTCTDVDKRGKKKFVDYTKKKGVVDVWILNNDKKQKATKLFCCIPRVWICLISSKTSTNKKKHSCARVRFGPSNLCLFPKSQNEKKTFLRKSAIWRIESFLFFQNPIIYQIIPSMRRFGRQSIRQHMMAVFEPKWNFKKLFLARNGRSAQKSFFFGYY